VPIFAGTDHPQGGGANGERREHAELRIEEWLVHVEAHIEKLRERLAEHHNAPVAVQNAAQKLLTDLNVLKGDLTAAKAALAAPAAPGSHKDLREKIKADHETVKTDREALHAAVEAAHDSAGHGPRKG
jgi:hypothetical protein